MKEGCVWQTVTLCWAGPSAVSGRRPRPVLCKVWRKSCKMCVIIKYGNMGICDFQILDKNPCEQIWFFLLPKWAAPPVCKSIKCTSGFWLNHFVICSTVTHKDYSANFSRKVIESFQFHKTFIRSMIFDDFQKYRSHLMSGASPWSRRHLSHFVAPCPTGALRKNPALQGPWHRELSPYKTCWVVKIKNNCLSPSFQVYLVIGKSVCVFVCVCVCVHYVHCVDKAMVHNVEKSAV